MTLPERVVVVEVGPRDGLQSLDRVHPTATKVRMIERVLEAGVTEVEAVSFVHPRVVPQLADAEEVMARLPRPEGIRYRGLVPNRRGAERAAAAGIDVMLGLLSCSEEYSRRNQNMGVEEVLKALEEVAEVARDAGTAWLPVISMAFFSPWEGFTPPDRVLELIDRVTPLRPAGVSLASTTGMAGPGRVGRLCRLVRERWPNLPLSLHLHNANGMALACALAGLQAGVTSLDASVCGIGGGIVLEKSADAGNVPTEDLVAMLDDLEVETGVDPVRMVDAAREVAGLLGVDRTGFTARAGTPEEVLAGDGAPGEEPPALDGSGQR